MEILFFSGKVLIWFLAIVALIVFDFFTTDYKDDDITDFFNE